MANQQPGGSTLPPGVTMGPDGKLHGTYTFQSGTDDNGNPIYTSYNYDTGTPSMSPNSPSVGAGGSATGYGGGDQGGNQSPNFLGLGQFFNKPYPINDQNITGNPSQGAGQNYGLNDVWGQMQNEIGNLGSQGGKMAVAPQFNSALGYAAQGTAAQGAAAQGAAALGNAAQYQAALGNAAQAGPVRLSTAGDAGWQGQQANLANILGTQAAGGGVSPADLQLQRGRDANMAAQLSILGSERGNTGNAGLAIQQAANQGAAANAQLNGQMGLQRAQETLQAQQALGNVLGTARGQSQAYNLNAAQLAQQGNFFNAGAQNQFGLANLGALNAANQGNAQLSQGMNLANLQSLEGMNLANLGNAQQMGMANLNAQNQFGLANLGNQQQMALTNLGDVQQQNLANQSMLGQYGLANQQMTLENARLYDQELNAMLGGMTGIGESNRGAALADQQLQVQQNIAQNQINVQAFQAAAQNNAAFAQALFGGIVGTASGLYSTLSNAGSSGGGGGGGDNTSPPDNSTNNWYDQSSNSAGYTDEYGNTVTATSDAKAKTRVADGEGAVERQLRRVHELFALSDENLKDGVTGGNPMLESFLREMRGSTEKDPKADIGEGLGFHNATTMRMPNPSGGAGPNAGSGLMQLAKAVPFLGTLIGLEQGASAAAGGPDQNGPTGATGPLVQTGAGSGITGEKDIGAISDDESGSGEDTGVALSDDREKEAVMSGNRGLQAFLEQQGAQTGAQNQLGAYNNAFMQTGMPPNSMVDRQLPPWMGGYGYEMPGYGDTYGGGVYGGGISQYGGSQGGGIQSQGGVTNMGGVTQGATVTPGGISSFGGQTNGQPTQVAPGGGLGGAQSDSGVGGGGLSQLGGNRPTPPPVTPLAGAQQLVNTGGMYLGGRPPPPPYPGQQLVNTGGMYLGGRPPPPPPPPGFSNRSIHLGGFAPPPPPPPGFGPRTIALHGLSDEREKTAVQPSEDNVAGMLDQLHAHQYRYKDPDAPGAGHGTFVSPMAQELERTKLGRNFVFDGPNGHKMVDYGKMAGTMLAGQAMLHERVGDLEDQLSMIRQLKASQR